MTSPLAPYATIAESAREISARAKAFQQLVAAGFTEQQARALAQSRDTVFIVPVGGAR